MALAVNDDIFIVLLNLSIDLSKVQRFAEKQKARTLRIDRARLWCHEITIVSQECDYRTRKNKNRGNQGRSKGSPKERRSQHSRFGLRTIKKIVKVNEIPKHFRFAGWTVTPNQHNFSTELARGEGKWGFVGDEFGLISSSSCHQHQFERQWVPDRVRHEAVWRPKRNWQTDWLDRYQTPWMA